jgi:hypothetical protein
MTDKMLTEAGGDLQLEDGGDILLEKSGITKGCCSIQSKIWRGYNIAAKKLGSKHQFFRPSLKAFNTEQGGKLNTEAGGDLLLTALKDFPGERLFTRHVSLNAEDMKYNRPNKYGKPTWYALVDGQDLQAGDYFIHEDSHKGLLLEDGGSLLTEAKGKFLLEGALKGTYFIAALQPLLPILVVECNRVVSLFKPGAQSGIGAQGYGGTTAANETLYAESVPCSILQGTKGEKSEANLPDDTRSPWWTVLMPSAVGRIAPDDIMIDDLDQRYVISSNELTDLGYRCTAMMALS